MDRLFRQQDGFGLSFCLANGGDAAKTCCQLVKKNGDTIAVSLSATRVAWRFEKYLFIIARESEGALPCITTVAESDSASSPEREDFPAIIGQSEKIRDVCRREHYLFFTHDLSKISYLSCYHSFCSVKVTYAESLEPGSF